MTGLRTAQPGVVGGLGRLAMTDDTDNDSVTAPATASAGFRFDSDGGITLVSSALPGNPREWWTAEPKTGVGNSFEVAYTTLVSGDPPNGLASPIGVYVDLSVNRIWAATIAGGLLTGVWRFRVRRIAKPLDFVEADFTVTASSLP